MNSYLILFQKLQTLTKNVKEVHNKDDTLRTFVWTS